MRNHTSTLPSGSTTVGVECQQAYKRSGFPDNKNFMNYAGGTSIEIATIVNNTCERLNTVHPLPSVTFPASALIPMARRSGMPAVVRAYDAGMSVPVLEARS